MKRNRYLFCLLATGFLIYLAVPRLSITTNGASGIFSLSWLAFAVIVLAGNLTGLLQQPKKLLKKGMLPPDRTGKKSRSYNG